MGTKVNPGKYDCYARAEDNEPMFILLGRDPIAPLLIDIWCQLKSALDGYGEDGRGSPQVVEARNAAIQLHRFGHERSPEYQWRVRLVRALYKTEALSR